MALFELERRGHRALRPAQHGAHEMQDDAGGLESGDNNRKRS